MDKILFNTRFGVRQAVLDGSKTNTRRDEKGLKKAIEKYEKTYNRPFEFTTQYYDFSWNRLVVRTPDGAFPIKTRYAPGEIVAVAQSYSDVFAETLDYTIPRYSFADDHCDEPGWKNIMFVRADLMPHQIRITNVRVERLQDISDEDCIKEGVIEDAPGVQYSYPTNIGYCGQYPFGTPRSAFAALIDKISGKGTWKRNPWVVVYQFELMK